MTAVTLTVLLGLSAAGAGTGISSLILSNKHYSELCLTIDEDIQNLERGISNLEKPLVSLSGVVL